MTEKEEWISQAQAARRLKRSARTVARMAEAGELTRHSETKLYRASEVDELAEIEEEQATNSSDSQVLTVLREVTTQLMQHNERLLSLFEKPYQAAMAELVRMNKDMSQSLVEKDGIQIQAQQALGDFLLAKEERAQLAKVTEARQEQLRAFGGQLKQVLPLILKRFQAGSPEGSVLKSFIGALSPEERDQIALLYWAFDEPEKRAAFKQILTVAGVEVPPNPEGDDNGSEAT